jgi:hypothetical protein
MKNTTNTSTLDQIDALTAAARRASAIMTALSNSIEGRDGAMVCAMNADDMKNALSGARELLDGALANVA